MTDILKELRAIDEAWMYENPTSTMRVIQAGIDETKRLRAEAERYLPVLERAEADPEVWDRLTAGLGIATLNGYRAAIAQKGGDV